MVFGKAFLAFFAFLAMGALRIGRNLGCGVYIARLGYGDLDFHQAGKVLSRKPAFGFLESPKVKKSQIEVAVIKSISWHSDSH